LRQAFDNLLKCWLDESIRSDQSLGAWFQPPSREELCNYYLAIFENAFEGLRSEIIRDGMDAEAERLKRWSKPR